MKIWLQDDYQVYNYFKARLEENIKDFGVHQINEELEKYHKIQNEIKEKCPIKIVAKKSLAKEDRPFGTGTEAYKILNKDPECQLIGMQELKFTSLLRKIQSKRISHMQSKK